uniref:AB hydrolase-1 domain-containing protein n=1 Tax=Ananas comosus var. bracteatus TaxID=296719 RepID=A0A6V7NFT8_ANACO|nr:unnamed protein product [Ananas comosus var. bracteatus]
MGDECGDHFVLVHGARHGAWCWFKLRWLLESSGRKVSCIDLAGPASTSPTPTPSDPSTTTTARCSSSSRPCRTTKNAGALSVVQAIHLFADKIKLAIFVAATMLPFGFRTDEDRKDGIPDISELGDIYVLNYGLGVDHPPTSAIMRKEFQRKLMYQLTPGEDSTLASMLLRPVPTVLGDARFGEGEEEEKRLKQVFTVDTDHSPFFAAPNELFELIVKASLI